MRKITILMLVILMGLPTTLRAEDKGMAIARALCEYIQVDDRSKIRKKLKRAKLKLRYIYKDTTCNGLSLLKWAEKHEAHEVIKFIRTKVKEDKL